MKVTIISTEFYEWGLFGGFGFFTRKLGKELVKRGIEVEAFMPKFSDKQKPPGEVEVLDGVKVKTLPRVRHKLSRLGLYRTDSDVIHSQCNPLDTFLTFQVNGDAVKLITFQDIRTPHDLELLRQIDRTVTRSGDAEMDTPKKMWGRLWYGLKERLYEFAIKQADYVATQTHILTPKVTRMYHLRSEPSWLPNFIDVPPSLTFKHKSASPSVAWLARLDPIKHVELCLDVAAANSDVTFYIMGHSNWPEYEKHLREAYADCKNIIFVGMVDEEQKEAMLKICWCFINTSFYEAMPVTFLEALAYGCPIVSTRNPDGYTAKFGAWSSEHTVSAVSDALRGLLESDWRSVGKRGYEYVRANHETGRCVERHIQIYKKLLEEKT